MKRTLRAVYIGKDGKEHTEIHTAHMESIECAINAVMISFNLRHPDDRLVSVWEIKPDIVVSRLKDILCDFKNGSLVFTTEDAEWIQYAINTIESIPKE